VPFAYFVIHFSCLLHRQPLMNANNLKSSGADAMVIAVAIAIAFQLYL